jgi:hypothetical protein
MNKRWKIVRFSVLFLGLSGAKDAFHAGKLAPHTIPWS